MKKSFDDHGIKPRFILLFRHEKWWWIKKLSRMREMSRNFHFIEFFLWKWERIKKSSDSDFDFTCVRSINFFLCFLSLIFWLRAFSIVKSHKFHPPKTSPQVSLHSKLRRNVKWNKKDKNYQEKSKEKFFIVLIWENFHNFYCF